MKRCLDLFMIAIAIAGCAANRPTPPGAGSGPGSGSGPGTSVVSIAGSYSLQSAIDLEAILPGAAGDVERLLVDATDDPDDPARFLVEHLVAQLPDGDVKDALKLAEPFIVGYVAERMQAIAPSFVVRVRALGDRVGLLARRFGTIEELEVSASGAAVHAVRGVRFAIEPVAIELPFHEHAIADVTVENVSVALAGEHLTIGDHDVALPYGRLVRLAIDGALIPAIDPGAHDLATMLARVVDCAALGQAISDALSLGAPAVFASACTSSLVDVAHTVYARLDALDSAPLIFQLAGAARARIDGVRIIALDRGVWTGRLTYAGASAPLGVATFRGARR